MDSDRFMRGAPKFKILPDWIPGIGGKEIMDPLFSKLLGYALWGGGLLRGILLTRSDDGSGEEEVRN